MSTEHQLTGQRLRLFFPWALAGDFPPLPTTCGMLPVFLGRRPQGQNGLFRGKFFSVLFFFLIGCGPSLSGPEACNELADALSASVSRCGADGAAARVAFVAAAAGGDCNTIASVRDEASLRDECLPFLRNVDCSIVLGPDFAAALPEGCKAQLEQ
jgi:hypothetical protein